MVFHLELDQPFHSGVFMVAEVYHEVENVAIETASIFHNTSSTPFGLWRLNQEVPRIPLKPEDGFNATLNGCVSIGSQFSQNQKVVSVGSVLGLVHIVWITPVAF
jgi:hypothetical protein